MVAEQDVLAQAPKDAEIIASLADRYIPVRAGDLACCIGDDRFWFGNDAPRLHDLNSMIRKIVDQEAMAFDHAIARQYACFDPDCDTIEPTTSTDEERAARAPDLLARLSYLFDKANFEKLTDEQIQDLIELANSHNLRVDLREELVEHLEIWMRGSFEIERWSRTFRHPIKGVSKRMQVFRRVVVLARLVDDPHTYIKQFKDIPANDIEALLPHAEVRMSLIDQLKVVGGGAGVLGSTAAKAANIVKIALIWSKLLWVIIFGGIILTVRALSGYRSARIYRDSLRTQHLYYQNLGNNVSVIHALVSSVAQEEAKEAMLVYAACHHAEIEGETIASADELKTRVERYLRERFYVNVQFDIEDAMESMARLDLWGDASSFRVRTIDDAIAELESHWREARSIHYHHDCAESSAEASTTPGDATDSPTHQRAG